MTDTRLPAHWLHDPHVEALSDRAWRTFTGMLMWSNEHGTDGVIPRRSMRLVHPEGLEGRALAELVDAELVEPRGAEVIILNWDRTQSRAADVEWQRQRNRDKNAAARQRERDKRAADALKKAGEQTGHVTGHAGGEDSDSDRRGQEEQASPKDGEYRGGPVTWGPKKVNAA